MDQLSIESQLLSGERILWAGAPGQGVRFTPRDVFLVPFSLLWCGFAIFWEVGAFNSHAPGFFPLFGLMFVCVGFYFVFGRFIADAYLRANTRYALTNQRVLIVREGLFQSTTSFSLERLPELRLSERIGGRGTISFGPDAPVLGQGFNVWSPSLSPQFFAIPDVRNVFDKIQMAIRAERNR